MQTLEANSDLLVEDRYGRPLPILKPIAHRATERIREKIHDNLEKNGSGMCAWARTTFRRYEFDAEELLTFNGTSVGVHSIGLTIIGWVGGTFGYVVNMLAKIASDDAAKAIGAVGGILLYMIAKKVAGIEFCDNLPRIAGDVREETYALARERIHLVK
jgi:hypothetical protein